MSGLKNFRQVRTSGCVKGFRSCKHNTAVPQALLDKGRTQAGEARRAWHSKRQIWLAAGLGMASQSRRS